MKLLEIARLLEAEALSGARYLDRDVAKVAGSDLMSTVLAFASPDALLLTGLTNNQVVRTAELADMAGVCFVNGRRPAEDVIRMAESKNIPLLASACSLYEACGRLYGQGIPDCLNADRERKP